MSPNVIDRSESRAEADALHQQRREIADGPDRTQLDHAAVRRPEYPAGLDEHRPADGQRHGESDAQGDRAALAGARRRQRHADAREQRTVDDDRPDDQAGGEEQLAPRQLLGPQPRDPHRPGSRRAARPRRPIGSRRPATRRCADQALVEEDRPQTPAHHPGLPVADAESRREFVTPDRGDLDADRPGPRGPIAIRSSSFHRSAAAGQGGNDSFHRAVPIPNRGVVALATNCQSRGPGKKGDGSCRKDRW